MNKNHYIMIGLGLVGAFYVYKYNKATGLWY